MHTRKILMLSPEIRTKETGITIRIKGMSEFFKKFNLKADIFQKLPDNLESYEFVYALISTKKDSITSDFLKNRANNIFILDLYTPILLEKKAIRAKNYFLNKYNLLKQRQVVKNIVSQADHFLFANHRQKEYWARQIMEWGIKKSKIQFSIVPTNAPVVKVKKKKGKSLLWFGGIYPWINPIPLFKALPYIFTKNPSINFKIIGGFQKGTGYYGYYEKSLSLIKNLGLKEKVGIISWQKPAKLSKYLEDVIVAVHIPAKTGEDFYSYRFRLLTLLNAGIPVLTSGSDIISKYIVQKKAGAQIVTNDDVLAKQIVLALKNPQKIKKWSTMAKKLESIIIKRETDIKNFLKFINDVKHL